MPYKDKEKKKEWRKKYRLENKEKIKERNKEYYLKNKEKLNKINKEYCLKNKEKLNKISKEYYLKNKEKHNKKARKNYSKNKEKRREQVKLYRLENKEKIRLYRLNNIQFKLARTCRSRITRLLKGNNITENKKTMELIGCSKKQLMDHFESQFREGMTWDNRGYKGWHIDHIIPCSAFDLTDPKQKEECCHNTNLQPLWWWENMSKSDRLDWKGTED